MTVSSTTRTAGPYTGTGLVSIYSFDFKVFSDDDLIIQVKDTGGALSTLVLGSDYTAAISTDDSAPGGVVTLTAPLAVGYTMVISSLLPMTQLLDLVNAGGFYPSNIEDALDRVVILLQQAVGNVGGSIRVPEIGGVATLPAALLRAGYLLGFDGSGNPILVAPVSGDATSLALNLADSTQASKGAGQVGYAASNTYPANTIGAAFKAFVLNLAATAGAALVGFRHSLTSAIARTVGAKLSDTVSVLDFGADPTGVADSTAAIQAAINSGARRIHFPATAVATAVYSYTQLSLDNKIGVTFVGDGAIAATVLRCTATGNPSAILARSASDCSFEFLTIDHASSLFTGYLVDCRHAPASSIDAQALHFRRCTFTSKNYNLYSAQGVCLDQCSGATFDACKFGGLNRAIDGQATGGASYSNCIRFNACVWADNVGFAANNPGVGWTWNDCLFEACHDGAQRIVFSDTSVTWQALDFDGCTAFDATLGGFAFMTLGQGQGLTVRGGMWGGIAGSDFINATGPIKGLTIESAFLSLFGVIAGAAVTGQEAWTIGPSNVITGSPTLVFQPGNVTGLFVGGNSPATSVPNVTAGQVTISNTATIGTVTLASPQPDTAYLVSVTATGSSGSPAAGANRVKLVTKGTGSFVITLEAAPGAGTSVTFDWTIQR